MVITTICNGLSYRRTPKKHRKATKRHGWAKIGNIKMVYVRVIIVLEKCVNGDNVTGYFASKFN